MTTVEADGVTLGVEHFGDAAAPLVLLAGGTTMLSWPDALCVALARGGRHVVRYDLRDCGTSTTVNPKAPAYKLRDLAADAAALARELDERPAHLAGIGVGGMVAQVAALDHPEAFSALTLAGTRPVAPGRLDDDLPDHDAATMARLFSRSMPDWSDRAAVAEFAAGGAEILGDDPAAARATAERIWDRTPGTESAVQMANQLGMVFAKLDCKPRGRLPELAMPALVVHGRRDPFFPVGNGEALAREIPGARLLVLERAATAIPDADAGEVAAAMLAL
jgi:pimeloyl-ACP methyl ester carboxylesterase